MTYFEKIKSMNFKEMTKLFKNLELCATEQIEGFSPDCSHCPYYSLDDCPMTDSRNWLKSEAVSDECSLELNLRKNANGELVIVREEDGELYEAGYLCIKDDKGNIAKVTGFKND